MPGGAQGSFWAWGIGVLKASATAEGMAVLLLRWPWSRQPVSPGPTVPKAGRFHSLLQGP